MNIYKPQNILLLTIIILLLTHAPTTVSFTPLLSPSLQLFSPSPTSLSINPLTPLPLLSSTTLHVTSVPAYLSSSKPATTPPSSKRIIFGLSTLAGFADVALFKSTNAFPTMMTGNTMKFIEAAINCRYQDSLFFLSLILIYTLSTALYRILSLSLPSPPSIPPLSTPRALSPLILTLFLLTDWVYPSRAQTLALLSVAYGLINSVSIESSNTITCMLTGHMHKLANAGVDGKLGKDKVQRRSMAVLGGFGIGVVGAVTSLRSFPSFMVRGFKTALGVGYFALMFNMNDKGGFDRGVWGVRNCALDEYDAACEIEDEE